MVSFTQLALALSSVVGTLAAPAPVTTDLTVREPSSEIDFELGPHDFKKLFRRQDYNQNWNSNSGGYVNYSPSGNGYSTQFGGAGDFVVGKGWQYGSTSR
jgi:endo-1,4-beta-xylanase